MKDTLGILVLILTMVLMPEGDSEYSLAFLGALAGVGMGLGALGSLFGAREGRQNRQFEQQRFGATQDLVNQLLSGGQPGQGENMLAQLLGQGQPDMPFLDMNLGQDPMFQTLRADPMASAQRGMLGELMGTGSPFDTSELFGALQPMRDERLSQGLAQTFAGAPGLGQRFGGATQRAAGDVTRQHLSDAALLDAQIGQQSHEAAQGRRLQAGGLSGQLRQNDIQGISQLLQGLMQQSQLGLGAQAQQGGLIQALIGAEQGRRGQDVSLAGILGGTPTPQGTPVGSALGGMGQLAMLLPLLLGNQGGGDVAQQGGSWL